MWPTPPGALHVRPLPCEDTAWTLCAPRPATALDRPVGQWLSNLRRPGALAEHPEWETALKAVDEDWNPAWPADWQRHYAALREMFVEESALTYVEPGSPCTGWTSVVGTTSSVSTRSGMG
ncbi:hypothetical protein [Streptomyces sp. NPDC056701]|uniref:hypothetical protein n=1 Tax=unclassified Streptomyces TaxID=2593676 RepID=UPI0036C474CA